MADEIREDVLTYYQWIPLLLMIQVGANSSNKRLFITGDLAFWQARGLDGLKFQRHLILLLCSSLGYD